MIALGFLAGSAALAFSLVLTPLVRRLCLRLHLYDLPGPLKIHSQPVPRLGGIAIAAAIAAGVAQEKTPIDAPEGFVLLAIFLIWLTGLLDDLRGLPPAVRLLAQVFAAALLWYGGWCLPSLHPAIFSLIATCLLVVFFVNAFNFLDGADGLAAGMSLVISLGYLALPPGRESMLGIVLGSSLLGACAGFLPFNFPPAKIFMGDSGSTILGFTVAFLGLDSYRAGTNANFPGLFPFIVAAIPLLDAGLAILRRLQNRGSPFVGDRFHFYDLLLARGWSPRRVVFVCCGITALLAVTGRMSMATNIPAAFLICIICYGGLLASGLKLGSLRPHSTPTVTRQAGI
ncbi:MAG: MraY family glycosyltransferase [Candidatus Acidiferrales bacterium]